MLLKVNAFEGKVRVFTKSVRCQVGLKQLPGLYKTN